MASTSKKQPTVWSEKDDTEALLFSDSRSSLDSEINKSHGEISDQIEIMH
jgi:hypothetical protein